jgi:hypothetical protein
MIKWIKNLFKKKEEPIVPLSPNNWTISRTKNRIVYKIPVGNLSKEDAEKQLKKLISNYQTNYWFPSPIDTKAGKIERILNRIQPKEEN